ncbi:GNAT family N-acetyltransferase [Novosphingobium resinovorum]|uniref:GNAT family N-acetyltransferase n=1 Tax=Novosphingobium TaxID=165696 RepID=UPI001B3C665E|nr:MULTISPECIES: GNAT family N-acetyltransferase [Novosphingobium]MBF7010160.1 GNAT family N-acetyltransferase [Novosphingobium sp. HR1a]WJM28177.1 GNAT family N-acetyltransferase [Novosphingobium resinovorum]
MFVRTERLFLRPAWPEDFDDLVEALSDDDVQRTVDVAPLPRSAEELRIYLDRPRDPRLPHFFMYLRAPGGPQLVGSIGLGRSDSALGAKEIEVGYWIVPRYRGRGYAGEALRAVVNQARSLGHLRVIASHFADSRGTQQVLESAGFHDTGQVRSRYSASRAMEHPARIYVADLDRRLSPRMEMAGAA